MEEARNAVGACRDPRLPEAPRSDVPGIRGDSAARAARYWGIQCEEMRAIENLPRMLEEVTGIGVVLPARAPPLP